MNPIEIRSQQQLDELKQKHGEAFFTMQKESIEAIVKLTDDQIDELFLLYQRLLFIFTAEKSATIETPCDALLLEFFINIEMAKFFDSPSKKYPTATLKNFVEIREVQDLLDNHSHNIKRLKDYRDKELAHHEMGATKKIDPKPVIEYQELLKEINDILFKVLYVYSKLNAQRLGNHNLFEELLHRNELLRDYYSNKEMLGKKATIETEEVAK